jgi:hypothetical protein
MEIETSERIAQHYKAMLDSVWVIGDVIAHPENYLRDRTIIERNVAHLEIMRAKSFWTDEDMTVVDAAIEAGRASFATQANSDVLPAPL